ncbi:MAG: hypothetical protein KDD69_04295 [Bdellovibrionales bacterium]|nr:hypothetical protein [Bdellovibrionales bacterium]
MRDRGRELLTRVAVAAVLFSLSACGGGGGGGDSSDGPVGRSGLDAANFDCDGSCPNERLSDSDVAFILQQAVTGAQQLGVAATIAVVDRVGNVLGVYQMDGAPTTTTITGQRAGLIGGLEGIDVPAVLAAISKAGTGAFLSSQGNAFGTRTASQIVQENFGPGEGFQAGGPLFGVQFSQLPCSDVPNLAPEFAAGLTVGAGQTVEAGLVGPRPLPLGLSADSGGIPLYKNGDMVGGIGVEFDGLYTLDLNVRDTDNSLEERVAMIGTLNGFETPSDRAADKIFVLGKSLRLTDISYSDLGPLPEILAELNPANIVSVPGFFGGVLRTGAVFGDPSSGIARTERAGIPAAVLVNGAGAPRFPSRDGTSLGGLELKANEVEALLDSAITTAFRARAAIRTPRDSQVHVSIWVVDTQGNQLGFVRTSDGPVFGIDVALQKARTATFFSSAGAGDALISGGQGGYVLRARELLGPDALTGTHAFADRSGGNLSRPFFPDGVQGNPPGPFSLPFPGSEFAVGATSTWSPFNTGLQLDLILPQVAAPLSGTIPFGCAPALGGLGRNGIQIFPGSVPLFRGTTLIGGLGISGDGIDQDDLVAFYGASRLGLDAAGHPDVGDPDLGFNAPREIRADTIIPNVPHTRLRYVNCPEAPFRGSNEQNVCDGL